MQPHQSLVSVGLLSSRRISLLGNTWARTTRALREILAPKGWHRSRDGGLETVVSPDGRVAIDVATGDEGTGLVGGSPKTKYSKGSATVAAVEQNQLCLFPDLEPPVVPGPVPADRVTWLLMIARGAGDVRCELSLPEEIGEDGKVEVWSERIILGSIGRDGEPTVTPADQGPDVIVDVSRRVS